MQQPAHRGLGLLAEPEPEQRLECVRRVADPGEAVVPVLPAALSLIGEAPRQRRRRRRGDRPARAVHQQLEQQRAAGHVVGPRPGRAELARPAPPRLHGPVQPRVDLTRGGQVQGLGLRRGHADEVARPGRGAERPVHGLVGDLGLDLAEQPHGQRDVVDAQHGAVHGVVRPRRRRVEARPGGDREPHVDPAGDPLDPAGQLRPRQAAGAAGVERVDDPDRARPGDVRGLQDVRARQVAPRGPGRLDRAQLEPAAAPGVEDRREGGAGVEVGDRPPVDAPVEGDERDGAGVADGSVGAQVGVAAGTARAVPGRAGDGVELGGGHRVPSGGRCDQCSPRRRARQQGPAPIGWLSGPSPPRADRPDGGEHGLT